LTAHAARRSPSTKGADGANRARTRRPRLVFFYSRNSGRSRRVEGYLSQVLQRRRNHDSFELLQVDVDEHTDLAERFRIDDVPTIVVVEDKRVRGRLASPRGCRDIERLLAPWLR
jgi:thioredoxin-like negative regulator of GroEL